MAVGFLQRLTVAGARTVPVRVTRAIRRLDHAAERPSRAAVPPAEPRVLLESATTNAGAVVTNAIAVPPSEPVTTPLVPAPPPTVGPRPVMPLSAAPGGPPAPVRPPAMIPTEPSRSVGLPTAPTVVEREVPRIERSAPPPLRRAPELIVDVDADRTALPVDCVERVRSPAVPAPSLTVDAPLDAAPRRIEPLRMKRDEPVDRPMPLPVLSESSTAPSQPIARAARRTEPIAPAVQPRDGDAAMTNAKTPALPHPSATAHLAPPPPAMAVAARQAAVAPGLTIHKLEIQVVERPREMPVQSVRAAVPPPSAPVSWEWPDRHHHGLVW